MSRTTGRHTHMSLSQSVNDLVAEGGYVLASDDAAASVLDTNSSIWATVDSQASTATASAKHGATRVGHLTARSIEPGTA